MEKIRVFTAFSGYDSQCLALRRIGVPFELVGWSEIDAFAIKAHNALFPESTDRNYGDISQIDWDQVPDFDLFTYSSPCQDFSQAGKQRGGEKGTGTRSSLLWECERAISAKRPKYLLMENVAALVSQKFIKLFQSWMTVLEGYGYKNFAQVLNAKDYGVPQNRERIFLVSIRVDNRAEWENVRYHFPLPVKLDRRLKDILEPEVDEKYYLSDSRLEGVLSSTQKEADRGNGFAFEPKDGDDVASTIQTSTTRKTDNYIKEEANNISVRQNGKLKIRKFSKRRNRIVKDPLCCGAYSPVPTSKDDKFINVVGNIYDASPTSPKVAGLVIDSDSQGGGAIRAGDNYKILVRKENESETEDSE